MSRLRRDRATMMQMSDDDRPAETAALLEKLRHVYESAKIYRDRGAVRVVGAPENPSLNIEATFRTSFDRATGELFFEFHVAGEQPWIIEARGETVTRVELSFPVEPTVQLADAIAGFSGITYGVAHQVPRLLLPNVISGAAVWNDTQLAIERDEVIDGETCAVLHRTFFDDEHSRVWIGRERGALRMREEITPSRTAIRTTVMYEEVVLE